MKWCLALAVLFLTFFGVGNIITIFNLSYIPSLILGLVVGWVIGPVIAIIIFE